MKDDNDFSEIFKQIEQGLREQSTATATSNPSTTQSPPSKGQTAVAGGKVSPDSQGEKPDDGQEAPQRAASSGSSRLMRTGIGRLSD